MNFYEFASNNPGLTLLLALIAAAVVVHIISSIMEVFTHRKK